MHSLKIVCAPSAILLTLLSGCASPPIQCPKPPDVPQEMRTPAPPSLYFQMELERILSGLPKRPTPQPTNSEPGKQ